jgi:hypothetical protein
LGCAESVYPEAILLEQCETGDDVAWSGMVKGACWLRLRRLKRG